MHSHQSWNNRSHKKKVIERGFVVMGVVTIEAIEIEVEKRWVAIARVISTKVGVVVGGFVTMRIAATGVITTKVLTWGVVVIGVVAMRVAMIRFVTIGIASNLDQQQRSSLHIWQSFSLEKDPNITITKNLLSLLSCLHVMCQLELVFTWNVPMYSLWGFHICFIF